MTGKPTGDAEEERREEDTPSSGGSRRRSVRHPRITHIPAFVHVSTLVVYPRSLIGLSINLVDLVFPSLTLSHTHRYILSSLPLHSILGINATTESTLQFGLTQTLAPRVYLRLLVHNALREIGGDLLIFLIKNHTRLKFYQLHL